ncbi:MAG: copper ion binding protein, partial [Clostridiales Family XIII bacterium]|nr:copper ion binding protein [Clostridiales Family XIII bacterium]
MEHQILSIRGMTCAACAQRIERTVRKLPGIQQAGVNLAGEKLFVEYDAAELQLSAIKESVRKLGYEAAEKSDGARVVIPIGGMSCAACAQRIEKALKKLDGVTEASVNLATEKATVSYEAQKLRASAIRDAIEKAGYEAREPARADADAEDRARRQKEIRTM